MTKERDEKKAQEDVLDEAARDCSETEAEGEAAGRKRRMEAFEKEAERFDGLLARLADK